MKTTANIVAVDARAPETATILRAVGVLQQGGVLVFPTHGLYGLGADAFNAHGVDRVFQIKGRHPHKPLLVLIDHLDMLECLTPPVSALARHLMDRLWPGWVTFVVPAHKGLSPGLTADSGTIGIRLTAHPIARALVGALGHPLTGTSANISGSDGCTCIAELDHRVVQAVDLILDAGPLAGGPGSTVVDVTGTVPVILRAGAVPTDRISALFHEFAGQVY